MSDVGSTAEEPMVCLTLRWRGLDSNFQYAEAVKLVVAAFSCADCLGRVGVLRFRPPRFERQAIRRSLAP